MPVYANSGGGLGQGLLAFGNNYLGAKRQRRQDDLFEEQLANAQYQHATQRAQNEANGLHILAPGELLPAEVSRGLIDYAGQKGNEASRPMPNIDFTSFVDPSPRLQIPQGTTPPIMPPSRAGAGKGNIPGQQIDRGPQYQVGKGFYLDNGPRFAKEDAARANMQGEKLFEAQLAQMMADQGVDRDVRKAGLLAPIDVGKAVATEQAVGPLRAQNATSQAVATAKAVAPINTQQAIATSHGTLGDRMALAGVTAGNAAKRADATNLNSILDDYRTDAAEFTKAKSGYEVLQGALKNRGIATPFSVLDAYARVVNPGAVVRQGTMETLKQMGSLDNRINRWITMAQKGEWPEDMLASVKNTIDGIMREHYQTYKTGAESRARQRAKAEGIDITPYLPPAMQEFETDGASSVPPVGGDTAGKTITVNGKTFRVPN